MVATQREDRAAENRIEKSCLQSPLVREFFDDFSGSDGGFQPMPDACGKDVGYFFHAGMKELFDLNQFGTLCARLVMDSRKTRVTSFQVRNADRIFIAHPESEMASRFGEQCESAAALGSVNIAYCHQIVEIRGGVGNVLIVGEFLNRCQENGV